METRHYIGSKTSTQGKSDRLQRTLLIRQQAARIAQDSRIKDFKIGQLEGSLIPVTDMDILLTDMAGALSSQIRAWPSHLMPRLQQYLKPECEAEVFALLTGDINGFLMELKTMPLTGHPEVDPDADDLFDEEPDDAA